MRAPLLGLVLEHQAIDHVEHRLLRLAIQPRQRLEVQAQILGRLALVLVEESGVRSCFATCVLTLAHVSSSAH